MGWLFISITISLILGGLGGWHFHRRCTVRSTARLNREFQHVPPPAPSADDGLQEVFRGIRGDLAGHFDSLNTLVEQLNNASEEDSASLRSEAEALVEKLALTYDEMRRFGDRLPVSQEGCIDSVTFLGNERALENWLQLHFAYLARYGNEFSIALFEIDFGESPANAEPKDVHPIVRDLAELISDSVRTTDRVFRYSTNEFVVTLPETQVAGAVVFANRITRAAAKAIPRQVACGLTGAMSKDGLRTLMNRADAALFQAKSLGQNRVCIHDGSRITEADDRPMELSLDIGSSAS